ncbi:MAG: hypothetical protein FWG16_05515 [Micrococcales bacterium]|nr:hypothetical protein [Micrococcales bacterium]
MNEQAVLVLEDSSHFVGQRLGAPGQSVGPLEICAAMTGYQEVLTDPVHQGQIMVMTAPHIGNTGFNDQDSKSPRIWVSGLVVRSAARRFSNWQAIRSLQDELVAHGVVGITEVDTRAITLLQREHGRPLRAGVFSGPALMDLRGRPRPIEELVEIIQAAP